MERTTAMTNIELVLVLVCFLREVALVISTLGQTQIEIKSPTTQTLLLF